MLTWLWVSLYTVQPSFFFKGYFKRHFAHAQCAVCTQGNVNADITPEPYTSKFPESVWCKHIAIVWVRIISNYWKFTIRLSVSVIHFLFSFFFFIFSCMCIVCTSNFIRLYGQIPSVGMWIVEQTKQNKTKNSKNNNNNNHHQLSSVSRRSL